MSTVDVTPEKLREAGKKTVSAAEPLGTIQPVPTQAVDGETVNIGGAGDLLSADGRNQISTARFPPGQLAQQALAGVISRFVPVPVEITNNARALSSALHIVADVYTTADHENAMEFAFVNPEAERPAGLPYYVNPKQTFESMRKKAEKDQRNGGSNRQPVKDSGAPRGTRTEERRVRMWGVDGIATRQDTIYYNEKGERTRIERVDYELDGGARFYSLTRQKDGDWTRSEEFYVGGQPPVANMVEHDIVETERTRVKLNQLLSGS